MSSDFCEIDYGRFKVRIPYTDEICPVCGRVFRVFAGSHSIWKWRVFGDRERRRCCSYTCARRTERGREYAKLLR